MEENLMCESKTVDNSVGCCAGSVPVPDVGVLIADRIAEFVDTIGANLGVLALDGYIDESAKQRHDFPKDLMNAPEGFKIDNERLEKSVIVPVDTIIRNPMNVLIDALKTNEFIKVLGITRIVGYYSRVTNWNRSKIGELRDRQKGNYGVSPVIQGRSEERRVGKECRSRWSPY